MTDPVAAGSPEDDERGPLEGVDADFGFGRRRTGRPTSALVDPLVGATIGGVSLGSLIAEGGMGRVYLGRQLRPDRPVAVKVVKPGLFSSSALRRFERESQMLASLHHPGIAQIHSFGTFSAADKETPFIVMEYIAGAKTITEFADERGMNVRDRLGLFLQACDAVSHAHLRGILHRDLKPGNILVAEDGRPKIIDFGVARQLDRDTILTTDHDDIGKLIGTIQYMAPEQFQGDAGTTDVRVDVYALGVVLCELLTGRPPFDLRQAALAEATRMVLDEEPGSRAFRDRRLSRDVQLIGRTCLAKDPRQRYASAVELSADIGRHLRGEPVRARPPSIGDAVRRLWRRHKAATAFVAGSLTVMMALTAVEPARRWLFPSPRRAAAMRPNRGTVVRPERKILSAADASRLNPVGGYLSVEARALEPAAAVILAALDCNLAVTLDEIDLEVAQALAKHRDSLAISGLTKLNDHVASALALYRGKILNLDSIESLSAAGSRSLAGYSGWLNLNGVRDWPDGGLEAIVTHEGGLSIGLAGISPDQAAILARHRGLLYVVGVERVDDAAARKLVTHEGAVDLWRAQGITPAAAAILRQRDDIKFPGR